MVLRCSLLGHDYGEPEVDREREERGSEVVLTVQTYEECARCCDRHIISENTEITSLTPDERREADGVDRVGKRARESPTADDGETEPPAADANATEPSTEGEDRPRTGAGTAGGRSDGATGSPEGGATTGTDRPSPSKGADTTTGANTDGGARSEDPNADTQSEPAAPGLESDPDGADRNVPTDENGEPIEDGEIMEEGGDRKPGEWPDSDDVGPPTGAGHSERWPDLDIDRVGGEELTYEDASERGERTADEATDSETESASTVTDSGTGIASAASAPAPGENPVVEPVDTEFYCPTCSFVAPGDHGSLRPGDICPDCGRGYIGERERK